MEQKLAYTLHEAAAQVGYSVRALQRHLADGNRIMRYANAKGIITHADLVYWLEHLPAEPK